MTKKLEDILNLPNVKEAFKQVDSKEKVKETKNSNGVSSKNLDPRCVSETTAMRKDT